jgi:hypothetical protein
MHIEQHLKKLIEEEQMNQNDRWELNLIDNPLPTKILKQLSRASS